MAQRKVDTAPDSWDTINLWHDDVRYAMGIAKYWYGAPQWAPGLAEWPAFDPWLEVVPRGTTQYDKPVGETVPAGWYLVPRDEWAGAGALLPQRGEYMRITCGVMTVATARAGCAPVCHIGRSRGADAAN